ncbi:hypothetical protein M9H77_18328 [Catharanthus roseus]|uniref:Uncharacterized protein n=1 Tax=Catharanthus roseus TaxID=4058 RepID=A0ACC0B765_CATRO|nr:hypothetical protein M9H77_18328 [Catharanthus roseus]
MREIAKWLIPLVVPWDLFENLSDNSQQHATSSQVGTSRQIGNKGMFEVSQNVDLSVKVDALSKKFYQLLALNTLPTNSTNVQKDMDTNDAMEARLDVILEQGIENRVVKPQHINHQQAMFRGNWQGYNTYLISIVKRMQAVQRSQTASLKNMECQIKLLSIMIIEKPLSNIPSNTVTLRDVEKHMMTFPIFMDDEDETAQKPESTYPRSQEPLPITTVVEESKKIECLPENKNECEESELERENESHVESNRCHKEGR